ITLRFNEKVVGIEKPSGDAVTIRLKSGKQIRASLLLYSIGRIGATKQLGLANIGIQPDERGRLKINENFQTTLPHIYTADYVVGIARYREIARSQLIEDTVGMLKLLFHNETKELLGVHGIGEGATELIHIGQAMMALDGKLDYFIDNVFNYPTLAEYYKIAT